MAMEKPPELLALLFADVRRFGLAFVSERRTRDMKDEVLLLLLDRL